MTPGFSFFEIDYWEQLESDMIEMVKDSLILLKSKLENQREENSINYVLNKCFLEMSRKKKLTQYGYFGKDRKPIYEAERISYEDDLTRIKRMGKRSDFQWQLYDDNADYGSTSYSVVFTVECKRLGSKVNGRDLCSAYVTQGIVRFVKEEWSYGAGAKSGVMVGYIQSLNEKEILKNVNQNCKKNSIGELINNSKKQTSDIYFYLEKLSRIEIKPKDFRLFHIWVDLR